MTKTSASIVAVVLLLGSATCFTILAIRLSGRSATPPEVPTTLASLPTEQKAAASYLNDVIGNRPAIGEDEARLLTQAVVGSDDLAIQGWGLVIAGDRLQNASMPPQVREKLEELIKYALDHKKWEVRRKGIACIDGSEIIRKPGFVERVRQMRVSDPQPEVRDRAALAKID